MTTWHCGCGARGIPEEVFSERCPVCAGFRSESEERAAPVPVDRGARRHGPRVIFGGQDLSELFAAVTLNTADGLEARWLAGSQPNPLSAPVGIVRLNVQKVEDSMDRKSQRDSQRILAICLASICAIIAAFILERIGLWSLPRLLELW